MHRAGQRCFELLALIGSLSFSNKVIPQLDKTLGGSGQTLRACTAAEVFFHLWYLKKTSEKIAEPLY